MHIHSSLYQQEKKELSIQQPEAHVISAQSMEILEYREGSEQRDGGIVPVN
jgi:hypothetical protein